MAAGRGSRWGNDLAKPLAEFCGQSLVTWAFNSAQASGLAPIVLVVGYQGAAVANAVPPETQIVHAADWSRGQAYSLRALIDALTPRAVDAVCVGLADQPLIGANSYRRLAAAAEAGSRLAVATYAGIRGNPVMIHRDLWDEIGKIDGDKGARALMEKHSVTAVDCTDTGISTDVDTLEELRDLEEEYRGNFQ